ncbi:MAG: hypothetical protein K0R75_3443, partial [Paenibacillaceae bacterium]|nr:hypothetical protein [Paenibacillaceae bacterium]
RHTLMGGVGTAGAVMGYYFGSRGGLFEQLDRQVSATEKAVYTPSYGINAEGKQYVMEQEALAAGVIIRYNTTVIRVIQEGKTVHGVECFSPELGSRIIAAKVVIDATGNADICRMAGCELRAGREFDGQAQPFSNPVFTIENGRIRGRYTDSGYVFPEDPDSLSNAIVESALLSTHLRERYEEGQRFLRVAPQLGIREGQFIVGEENVTLDRFLLGDYSSEPLFMAYSNLDNHSKDVAFESELLQDWTVAASLWGMKFTVPIPLGAMIPRGYDGLLAAGRSLAVDHDMATCVRMKRDMQKCGEAAAYASQLSIRNGVPLRDVAYAELAGMLRESGCLAEHEKVYFEHRLEANDSSNPFITWLTDSEEIKAGLAGVKPGVAIWSVRLLGDAMRPKLLEWLGADGTDNEHLRKHSAIALALIGAAEAAPVLLEMAREKDPFVPRTSLKYNQARGYTAVYLLGKLGCVEAIPDLIDILNTREGFTYIDSNKEFLSDERDLRFQYVSFSLTALARIGDRHPESRQAIAQALTDFASRLDQSLMISFKGSSEIFNIMDDKIRQLIDSTLKRWEAHAAILPQSARV